MVLGSVLISFFYMYMSIFPSTSYWRGCLFSTVYFCLLYILVLFQNCFSYSWSLAYFYIDFRITFSLFMEKRARCFSVCVCEKINNIKLTFLTIFKCTVVLTVCTLFCDRSLELFHFAKLKFSIHWTTLLFLLSPAPGNHSILSVSIVYIPHISGIIQYLFGFLWLAYYIQHNVLKVH